MAFVFSASLSMFEDSSDIHISLNTSSFMHSQFFGFEAIIKKVLLSVSMNLIILCRSFINSFMCFSYRVFSFSKIFLWFSSLSLSIISSLSFSILFLFSKNSLEKIFFRTSLFVSPLTWVYKFSPSFT